MTVHDPRPGGAPTALASFKDLCVDAVDPLRLGTFWAAVLGRHLSRREDGLVVLTGPTPRHTVWVAPVPEPVTTRQRVHLVVHAARAADVLALGATAVDTGSSPRRVLRDPEGGELCVVERDEVPAERLAEVVVDSADPARQAHWWAGVLGGRVHVDGQAGRASVTEVSGAPFAALVLRSVPEPKTVKNRVHWDVDVAGTAGIGALVARGARVLREPDGDIAWTVMADPEGNEFCVFAP